VKGHGEDGGFVLVLVVVLVLVLVLGSERQGTAVQHPLDHEKLDVYQIEDEDEDRNASPV
jgi:hypothetical protein